MGTEPDIAAGSEINADNTAITIFLREGLKWSDGHPLTTEDIRFAYVRTRGSAQVRSNYTVPLAPACNPNHTTLMAA